MSKEEKIRIAFEELYKDVDRRILYAFYIFLPALFMSGVIYKQPILAVLGCLCTISILYIAFTYIIDRSHKNIVITLGTIVALIFFQCSAKGIPEAKYSYFIFLYVLVLYRDKNIMLFMTIIAFLYIIIGYTLILTDNNLADFVKNYLLESTNNPIERAVFSFISIILAYISAFIMVNTLYLESYNNILTDITKKYELQNYHQNLQFADEIAKGNLNAIYNAEADDLGISLLNMRENLKKADAKDDQDRFISETTAEISEILRQHTQDIELLTDRVLNKLIQRLDAAKGAIYLAEGTQDDMHLDMVACYAYHRKKYLHQRIEIGDGLVGQTFLEGLTTFITKVPSQYKPIDAGLGDILPSSLMIIPLKVNNKTIGILEIAFLREIDLYERSFLEKIADNIASTLITARSNEETQYLYQQAQLAAVAPDGQRGAHQPHAADPSAG